jgi:hypothetical protein
VRFKNYGLAPKSAADLAFLLHGFHYVKQDGVMSIILPQGVLFRGGVEERIRTKLLKDGHIDTVIGLPAKAGTQYFTLKGNTANASYESYALRSHHNPRMASAKCASPSMPDVVA